MNVTDEIWHLYSTHAMITFWLAIADGTSDRIRTPTLEGHSHRAGGACRCWPRTGWSGTARWSAGCCSTSHCWLTHSRHFPFPVRELHPHTVTDKIKPGPGGAWEKSEDAKYLMKSHFKGHGHLKIVKKGGEWPQITKMPLFKNYNTHSLLHNTYSHDDSKARII